MKSVRKEVIALKCPITGHYRCITADCAWWIGDEKEGICAVKNLAITLNDIGNLADYREISKILDKTQKGGNV